MHNINQRVGISQIDDTQTTSVASDCQFGLRLDSFRRMQKASGMFAGVVVALRLEEVLDAFALVVPLQTLNW